MKVLIESKEQDLMERDIVDFRFWSGLTKNNRTMHLQYRINTIWFFCWRSNGIRPFWNKNL